MTSLRSSGLGTLQDGGQGKGPVRLDPEKVAEALQKFAEEATRHVASAQTRRKWSEGARRALLEGCDSLAQVRSLVMVMRLVRVPSGFCKPWNRDMCLQGHLLMAGPARAGSAEWAVHDDSAQPDLWVAEEDAAVMRSPAP